MCIGWLKKKNVKKEAVSPQETTEKETSQSSPEERVFTFDKLPESLAEFQFLPQANLASPYQTTALTVVALATYRKNPELCFSLIGFLQGPKALTPYGRAFIKDWLMGKDYKPYSYFKGATPPNGYAPLLPYEVKVTAGPYSDAQEGYKTLFLQSSGADSPRMVRLVKGTNGFWYLDDEFLLADIRTPER
ncbi:MAG: hypothetical protein LKM30_04620 [Bacilli bacterium]|nr:hypothetical protein [Bacilli bacterium]